MPKQKPIIQFKDGITYIYDVQTYAKCDLVIDQDYSFLFGSLGIAFPVIYTENLDDNIVGEVLVKLNETVEMTEFGDGWMTVTIKNKYTF